MCEGLVRSSVRLWPAFVAAALVGACGKNDQTTAPLPVSAQVSLAAGSSQVFQDTQVSGALEFPAAGPGGASYLVVGQFGTSVAATGNGTPFSLGSQAFAADLRAVPSVQRPLAQQFHDMLRQKEAEFARQGRLAGARLRTGPLLITPPTVGDKRTFKVCGNLDCSTTKNVRATAQFVGTHAAIFLDDTIPVGGFSAADINEVGTQFDQVLYPIDTDRFGAESDIDNNGVVIVLLTHKINELVAKPSCSNSFITGFFFGGDIAPGFSTQYNNGEIFYGLVPDPAGSATMCAYSTAFVKHIIPVTFIHEFQHMISFNQHVLIRNGNDEVLWLNEAMSHLAEELGGMHYDSAGIDTTASRFYLGDLYNAYVWMRDPASNALVTETPPGSLQERGAGWLFLRWLADQYGASITRSLAQTSLTGGPNVVAVTGTPFRTLVARWAIAVYANDAPGITPASVYTYTNWKFRTIFSQLHAQDPADFPVAYPLQPDSGQGVSVTSSGTLLPGGGAYVIATQLPNSQGFQLKFRRSNGLVMPSTLAPQLAVYRLH